MLLAKLKLETTLTMERRDQNERHKRSRMVYTYSYICYSMDVDVNEDVIMERIDGFRVCETCRQIMYKRKVMFKDDAFAEGWVCPHCDREEWNED